MHLQCVHPLASGTNKTIRPIIFTRKAFFPLPFLQFCPIHSWATSIFQSHLQCLQSWPLKFSSPCYSLQRTTWTTPMSAVWKAWKFLACAPPLLLSLFWQIPSHSLVSLSHTFYLLYSLPLLFQSKCLTDSHLLKIPSLSSLTSFPAAFSFLFNSLFTFLFVIYRNSLTGVHLFQHHS